MNKYHYAREKLMVNKLFEGLKKKKSRKPLGYWQSEKGKREAIKLTKNLVEKTLKLFTSEEIYSITAKDFRNNKLSSMLSHVFGDSPSAAIIAAYPGRFEAWKFHMAPMNTWRGVKGSELAIELTRRLIEEYLVCKTDEQIYSITGKNFTEFGLSSMLSHVFKNSPSAAIMAAYPNRFEVWRFKRVPQGYWKSEAGKQKAIELTKDLIENKLRLTTDEEIYMVSQNHFAENGLDSMLQRVFNSSPSAAVIAVYPRRFDPWRFHEAPKNYWKGEGGKERGIKLTKRLIEVWLSWTTKEQIYSISKQHFIDNELGPMLKRVFNSSPSVAVMATYPGKFKEWKFTNAPQGIWKGERGRELGIRLTKELIEKELNWNLEEEVYQITVKDFKDFNKCKMVAQVFHGSPYAAIIAAYPEKIDLMKFNRVPSGTWKGKKGRELGIQLTKNLIEIKLGYTKDEEIYSITHKHFIEYGLNSMLKAVFNGSHHEAIMATYPNRLSTWKFYRAPPGTWSGENGRKLGIRLTQDLIENKLSWTTDEQIFSITARHFKEHNLWKMLQKVFNNSPSSAVMAIYPGRFSKKNFQDEYTRRFLYYTKVGRDTEKLFIRYIEEYCRIENIILLKNRKVGNGFVEIWIERDDAITIIDITRASTRKPVRDKWRKRDYHNDSHIDELWIVINSNSFNNRDFALFREESPDNVFIYHISEIFQMFGNPPNEIKLELEKLSLIRFYEKEKVERLFQEALLEGRDYIIPIKEIQKKMEEFNNSY